jgi:hypothetical protein
MLDQAQRTPDVRWVGVDVETLPFVAAFDLTVSL